MHRNLLRTSLLVACAFCVASSHLHAAPPADLALREEAAFRAAVAEAAPSVVAIETIGGLETVGELLVGTGPSSGLIVSEDGYIVSSTFNFAHKPASIIVALADGTRIPAKLIARDEARNWVLLKIDAPRKLPVPKSAPEAEFTVGQWSIAIGRSFDASQPNLSVGVVSALNRIWGKAVQTDAKISSANYGGALVDVRGRVLGVLVPLSPNAREEIAGADWYDSGIGFAVPLDHILSVLPRLKSGENLKSGLLGISFKGPNVYADPPLISKCRAGSPAYDAGIRPGDRITAIAGRPVEVQAQVMEQLHRRYAGDVLKVTFVRGTETLERELKLVEKLEPYQRPFFGLLAERTTEPGPGATVRYVYPDSPAAQAGLQAGDLVTKLQGIDVHSRDELRAAAADLDPGKPSNWEFTRNGAKQTATITPVVESDTKPTDLPELAKPAKDGELAKPVKLKITEYPNTAELYVPPQYDEAVPSGLAVLIHPKGDFADKTTLENWRSRCRDMNWLLLVPQAVEGNWAPRDVEYLQKVIDRTAESYRVDAARTALIGYEEGGVFAYRTAARFRDRVRCVATINAVPPGIPAENEPANPVTFIIGTAKDFAGAARVTKAVEQLRTLHFPVVQRELPAKADDWDDKNAAELLRRLDALDRI